MLTSHKVLSIATTAEPEAANKNIVPILRFSDEQWKHLISEKWNKEDSQLLLDYVEEAYGQWETVAGLFRSRYTVEECIDRFNYLEMKHREFTSKRKREESAAKAVSAPAPGSMMKPRLTERQQLALLLKESAVPETWPSEPTQTPTPRPVKPRVAPSKPDTPTAAAAAAASEEEEQENELVMSDESDHEPHEGSEADSVSGDSEEESDASVPHSKRVRRRPKMPVDVSELRDESPDTTPPKYVVPTSGKVPKPADWAEWSGAKKKAWELMGKNPNAFFYRHTAPGEKQNNGKWAVHEHEMFMRALKKHPPNGHWGLFAIHIPGRVGYQCRNYYHHLLSTGQLRDKDYMDERGRYTAKKVRQPKAKSGKRSRGKRERDDDDGEDLDELIEEASRIKPVPTAQERQEPQQQEEFSEPATPEASQSAMTVEVAEPAQKSPVQPEVIPQSASEPKLEPETAVIIPAPWKVSPPTAIPSPSKPTTPTQVDQAVPPKELVATKAVTAVAEMKSSPSPAKPIARPAEPKQSEVPRRPTRSSPKKELLQLESNSFRSPKPTPRELSAPPPRPRKASRSARTLDDLLAAAEVVSREHADDPAELKDEFAQQRKRLQMSYELAHQRAVTQGRTVFDKACRTISNFPVKDASVRSVSAVKQQFTEQYEETLALQRMQRQATAAMAAWEKDGRPNPSFVRR